MDSPEDNLSFSSMAQHPPAAMKPDDSPSSKQHYAPSDPNFTFSLAGPAASPSLADLLLISNGQLLPPQLSARSLPSSNNNSRRSCSTASRSSSTNSVHRNNTGYSSGSGRSCLIKNGSEKNSEVAPKRVSFQLNEARTSGGANGSRQQGRKQGGARKRKEKQAGLFGFLVSACRECRAFEPSKSVETSGNTAMVIAV